MRATLRRVGRIALIIASLSIVVLSPLVTSAQPLESRAPLIDNFQDSLTDLPAPSSLTVRGNIYVPAYSSILAGSRGTRIFLATTLTIHNTSSGQPLVIEQIDYFDTTGKLVERFLKSPVALRPLGTIEIFVAADDKRGGSGANFVVSWAATAPITEPVVETVMIGTVGTTSYSFVSQGRPVRMTDEPVTTP